ncbi:uncharacterized protein LOC126691005 [Quercus robur]|uniref:uncharacterized protein LOC126691005 n=1 Tax=Quercus robur TaxID=38942 RepID=UPI0021611395|nr:uncharacterized protein LOC126691005 [Quercus robur]
MTPILSFLQDGHLPQDIKKAKKVRKRAARFMTLNDTLYKKGFSMPYLKCVDEEEVKYILEEIHERIWDSTDDCIRQWAAVRQSRLQGFLLKSRDQEQYSSPGHPQVNGQTKVTNRRLLKIIKARLDDAKGAWLEEFPNVLWAYKTTARIPTGETPFRLTYGIEVVIPVEVGITNIRRETFHKESNDNQLRVNLDCLDEVKNEASNKMTKYQQKMVEYYNKKVKLKRLDIGDLVLRKVTPATKDLPKGNSAQPGKDPTRSSITLDKAVITWRP